MYPGRYPSPTPDRESTPIEFVQVRPNVIATSPQRPCTPDYTAPERIRKRPRFEGSQSEPNISRHSVQSSTLDFPSPSPSHRVTDRRRVSAPTSAHVKPGPRRNDCAIKKPINRNRTVSTPNQLPSLSSNLLDKDPSSERCLTPCHPLSLSLRQTEVNLHKKLLEHLSPCDGEGIVYVIKDVARADLGIKIGVTTCFDYTERLKQHARNCEFVPEELYATRRLMHCKRTEILIHTELKNFLRHWECTTKRCDGTKHTEYFCINENLAVETVKKWEAFMNGQRPYDFRKKLNPLWKYLLRQRVDAHTITADVFPDTGREYLNHMLSPPTYSDYASFIGYVALQTWHTFITTWLSVWTYLAKFFWQATTVVYGFITLVAFRNTFASCAFAVILVSACFSVLPQSRKLKLSARSRVKSS